jgi:hypothetical protein
VTATIDHLLFGASDLESGVGEIERLTGVRPVYGGQHPGLGTHNALLSLGERTYLEVIAPDPSQADVHVPLPFGIGDLQAPRLVAWAVAPDDIDEAARAARSAGVEVGEVSEHTRTTPGGGEVRWRMAVVGDPVGDPPGTSGDRAADATGGTSAPVVPFLIHWGTGPHPAARAPLGVRLLRFSVSSPEQGQLERTLRALGVGVDVRPADQPALHAVLAAPSGTEIELRS